MLPEYGGQKVKLGEQELFIYRDTDIIAKMEWMFLYYLIYLIKNNYFIYTNLFALFIILSQ